MLETLWQSHHMPHTDLLIHAQAGHFDTAAKIALTHAQKDGFQAELMSNLFEPADPFFRIFSDHMAIFLSQPLSGPISQVPAGIHLNPVIIDPTWARDGQDVEAYPLFVPLNPTGNLIVCHNFPANAEFKSHYYQNNKSFPSQIMPVVLQGKEAAIMWRPMLNSLNKPFMNYWIDISQPENLLDVAKTRGENPQLMMNRLANNKIFVVLKGGRLSCYKWVRNTFLEVPFPDN